MTEKDVNKLIDKLVIIKSEVFGNYPCKVLDIRDGLIFLHCYEDLNFKSYYREILSTKWLDLIILYNPPEEF